MARLGDELGVSAMAVYRHFASKDELIDGILDHFVQTADVVGHGTDPRAWRLWLRRTTVAQYHALADTPGVLPFVATSRGWRFGPAASRVREQTLAVLRDAGFGSREAAERVTSLLALAVGWATIEADASGLERAIDRLLD
jgi:AcrR family transcriptional regulator